MKKKLLFTAIACITFFGANAQTIWNLGGDPAIASNGAQAFPISSGIGIGDGTPDNPIFPVIINGLSITGISTNANMGAVSALARPFTDANNKSYNFANRFQFNGSGYAGALNTDTYPADNMPAQRYLSFTVSGNSTVYAIGVSGSSASARNIFVTDGSNLVGSMSFPAATTLSDAKVTYIGPQTTLYVFCNATCNLCYLSATGVITSDRQVLSDKGVSFNGTEILNNKGLSLEVYNVLGKKIASSITSISTTNLPKGVYIVRISGSNDSIKICI